MEAINHGSPRPRNTFTELLPLTFPTEASADFSIMAAVLLAKVSGILVPRATNVMAVILASILIKQPNIPAKSPMIAVIKPINAREMMNVGQPPRIEGGGTHANIA